MDTERERARKDLGEWMRGVIATESKRLVDEFGIEPELAEFYVRMVLDDLARASFEKSRAGGRT